MADSENTTPQGLERFIKSHSISSDGETFVMRSGSDVKDLINLGIDLSCEQKKNVMAGVFGFRGVARQYPSVKPKQ